MMKRNASSQVSWTILMEGVASARLRTHTIQHIISRMFKVFDSLSDDQKDEVSAALGDVMSVLPATMAQLETDLDRTSYALSMMGRMFLEPRLSLSDRQRVQDASDAVTMTPFQRREAAVSLALASMASDWMGPTMYNTNRSTRGLPPGTDQPDYPWTAVRRPESLGENRVREMPGLQLNKQDTSGSRSADLDVALYFRTDPEGPISERTRTLPEEGSEYGYPYMDHGHMYKRRRTFHAMVLELVAESWTLPKRHRRRNNTETRQTRRKDRLRYKRNSQRRLQQKRWRQRNKNKLKRYHKDYNKKWRGRSKLKPARSATLDLLRYEVGERSPDNPYEVFSVDRKAPDVLHRPLPDQSSGSPGNRVILDRSDSAVTRDTWRLTAARAPFLVGLSPSIANRAKGVVVSSAYKIAGGMAYQVAGSQDEQYIVRVSQDGLRVACSCSFWEFGGPEHWASQDGYLFGAPVGSASPPVARDPKGVNRVCKHVYAVLTQRGEI